jgi:hypothetical protein
MATECWAAHFWGKSRRYEISFIAGGGSPGFDVEEARTPGLPPPAMKEICRRLHLFQVPRRINPSVKSQMRGRLRRRLSGGIF